MGQAEVIKLLEKSKKPLSAREINEKLNYNGANENLKKLRKNGEVHYAVVKRGNNIMIVYWL